mmetsp:Transcript_42429/g.62363  ORF Transcript_42429/g.62363 Transcript_42429/m.62363 type:complete len:86 (+) Transcript_42429:136-393(+)
MHSNEGSDSEGGDSLDSLSLQHFQGSASEEEKEEGSAAEEEEELTIRDKMIWREMGRTLDRAFEFKKQAHGHHQDRRELTKAEYK